LKLGGLCEAAWTCGHSLGRIALGQQMHRNEDSCATGPSDKSAAHDSAARSDLLRNHVPGSGETKPDLLLAVWLAYAVATRHRALFRSDSAGSDRQAWCACRRKTINHLAQRKHCIWSATSSQLVQRDSSDLNSANVANNLRYGRRYYGHVTALAPSPIDLAPRARLFGRRDPVSGTSQSVTFRKVQSLACVERC